jgi:hypothetical protein
VLSTVFRHTTLFDHFHQHNSDELGALFKVFCHTALIVNNIEKRLYNKLPNKLTSIKNILHFRRKLKLFLLQQTFYSLEEYFIYKN